MSQLKVSYAPSVRRLPSYLVLAKQALECGDEYISGTVIASELGLESIQVRKDLAITGLVGKPKRGYAIEPLILAIESYLDWDKRLDAIIVGSGNLGSALAGFPGFRQHGLHIVAAFDVDPAKIGTKLHDSTVYSLDELSERVAKYGVEVAILTVPAMYAQDVTTKLVDANIKSIWNFTNVSLKVPANIVVQNEDLSSGYAILCMKRRLAETKSKD